MDQKHQNAKTAKTFDEFTHHYSEAVNDSINFSGLKVDFFTKVKFDYLMDICRAHFGQTKELELLDVGCGVGNIHKLVSENVGQLSGVDISNESVNKAGAENKEVLYKTYDGETLPYADNSFDVAYAICVVHHVPVELWENFTREMHRVVKPNGLAIIFEHNPLNPLTMRVVNNCPFDADAVLLKGKKTTDLLQKAGFKSTKKRFIITIPPSNRFLRRVDGLFSRLPLGAQYFVAAHKN